MQTGVPECSCRRIPTLGAASRLRFPDRCSVTFALDGGLISPPSPKSRPGTMPPCGLLRLEFRLDDDRYVLTRLEATSAPDGQLDVELVRRFRYAGVLRWALRRLVEGPPPEVPRDINERVAFTYAISRSLGIPPTKAVAEDLRISYTAASSASVAPARRATCHQPAKRGRTDAPPLDPRPPAPVGALAGSFPRPVGRAAKRDLPTAPRGARPTVEGER